MSKGLSLSPKETSIEEQVRLLILMDEEKAMLQRNGRKWDLKEGLESLGIDPSIFADEFVLSVIQFFMYFRSAPHQAFASYNEAPCIWVEMVPTLDGALGSRL